MSPNRYILSTYVCSRPRMNSITLSCALSYFSLNFSSNHSTCCFQFHYSLHTIHDYTVNFANLTFACQFVSSSVSLVDHPVFVVTADVEVVVGLGLHFCFLNSFVETFGHHFLPLS